MARKSGRGRAKGGGANKTRQYVRDNSGRFASTPGGGKKAAAKPAAKTPAKPAAKTPAKPKAPPKTTTARGRARTKAAEARKALKAGAGTRAARSLAIAQKAADYYKATGTGTKRKSTRAAAKPAAKPAAKAKSAPSKPAKSRGSGQTLKPPPKQFLSGQVTRPGSKPSSPTTLDETRWRRIAQRVQTRGEVRALIESNRPGGLNQATEKRVFAAYATRQRAETFLRNFVTKPAAPGSMRRVPVSGLSELNQRFAARKVGGTGSTFTGVAARNRIYDEAQRAKRAARKAARAAGTSAAAPKSTKPRSAAKPAKPKRQTKRQRSDAYIERIQQVGQGRTGIKAKRAAKVQERARFFASLLASSGKTSKKGLVGQDLVRERLASAFANPASIRSTAKQLRQTLRRTALSGPAGFVRPGQTQRAKRRLGATSSRVQSAVLGGTISPSRLSASRQVAERASAWYSGQRSAQRPGPVRRPAPVRPLMPAKPEAAKPAAKPKSKRQAPKQRVRRRLATRVAKVQSRSDLYAQRRVFQSRVVGYQGNLLGKPTPIKSRPRSIGKRTQTGAFVPNVPARRR